MLRRIVPFAADLWQHRELLWQFTLRNVELRHKGSHLGLIWSFLSPLLSFGLYVMVFGYVFGGHFGVVPGETKLEYGLGVFLGLTLFHFLSEVIGMAPTVITANPNFVKKIVFPLEVLPAALTGSAVFHLLISLGLALIGLVIAGLPLTWQFLWVPAVLVAMVILGLGIGWLLSALGVFFRDIGQMTQFMSMLLMWTSGVFFTAAHYPAAWRFLRFNPLLLAIEITRDALIWQRPVNLTHVGYMLAASLVMAYLGYAAFRRMKPAFADVI